MKKNKITLRHTITITGCTDKTCRDCDYWGEEFCQLFRKKLKEYKDKAYQIKSSFGDGFYYDFARCKECLAAEV